MQNVSFWHLLAVQNLSRFGAKKIAALQSAGIFFAPSIVPFSTHSPVRAQCAYQPEHRQTPCITITRKDGDSHRFTLADRGAYTGVIASWLHTREPAKNESTTVKRKRRTKKQKKEPEAKQGDYLVGTDENVLVLNRTYANRSNAERAAKMQWERLQRGVASFSLQLAEGRADLYTEMPVKVSGFKQPIDDAEWTITTLTHTVSPDNGFTTSLELEVRIDDFEME